MSTSLLYHAFGLRGYDYVRTEYSGGITTFWISPKPFKLCCPACGCKNVIRKGEVERAFKTTPIGCKPVNIAIMVPRIECKKCLTVRQIEIDFASPRHRHTRGFEQYALELSRHMTIQDVAEHLGVSWGMIKDIQKRHLYRRYRKPRLKHLKEIAIDEICIGKGYRYLTIVLDLGSGAVVFVGEGKSAEALEPFWRRLRASGAKVEAVAIDMSRAYISAVMNRLPKAKIVFDHFHIIMLYNDKLTKLRRALYREAKDLRHKEVLKGTRWLLLKHPENLDNDRNEEQRLRDALKLNEPLATAYYMKEELRFLWTFPNKRAAAAFLTDWIARAAASGIAMLKSFAKTLTAHMWGILNWYDHPISTAPLEGTNNKIKTMQRQSYGFRDYEFFKLKIYAIHRSKYALVG